MIVAFREGYAARASSQASTPSDDVGGRSTRRLGCGRHACSSCASGAPGFDEGGGGTGARFVTGSEPMKFSLRFGGSSASIVAAEGVGQQL